MYVINTFPAVAPVTIPAPLTPAMTELEEVHVPPIGEQLRLVFEPLQTFVNPVIFDGESLTVMILYLAHADKSVYVIVTTPAEIPETFPELTVATVVFDEVHTPPAGEEFNEISEPSQTIDEPTILLGTELTVTTLETLHPVFIE